MHAQRENNSQLENCFYHTLIFLLIYQRDNAHAFLITMPASLSTHFSSRVLAIVPFHGRGLDAMTRYADARF